MPCSISLSLPNPIELNSIPNDGAAEWMAPNTSNLRDISGVPQDPRTRHARRDLSEQFQPFPAHAEFKNLETGGITAWTGQALDKTRTDWINDLHEHDRNGVARLQQRPRGCGYQQQG